MKHEDLNISAVPCKCKRGTCAAFVEPAETCVNRMARTHKVILKYCYIHMSNTWHADDNCLKCTQEEEQGIFAQIGWTNHTNEMMHPDAVHWHTKSLCHGEMHDECTKEGHRCLRCFPDGTFWEDAELARLLHKSRSSIDKLGHKTRERYMAKFQRMAYKACKQWQIIMRSLNGQKTQKG